MNSYSKHIFSGTKFSQALLTLLGFSAPISTALDNLFLALLLVSGLLICGREALKISYRNPVALAAMMLFGVLLVATLYGVTPFGEAVSILGKYIDLAMIPLFMALMRQNQDRDSALNGFMLAMLLTLILSYLVGFEVLKVQSWMHLSTSVDDPAIFRHYLTQNTFMALAVFLALLRMRETTGVLKQFFWGAFALLGIINVLFMMMGRTGYIIILVLISWFAWTTLSRHLSAINKPMGWRHAIAIILLIAMAIVGTYSFSSRLQTRVDLAISELSAWEPGIRSKTSVGDRLEFYYNALQISRQHPIAGVGTGGFYGAYEKQAHGKNLWIVHNPHNEYLMITVQTGLIGLSLLLYLFYTIWRHAPLLGSIFKQDAARGMVLATMTDCLFNSPLLDHASGLLFALMIATFFAKLETDQRYG